MSNFKGLREENLLAASFAQPPRLPRFGRAAVAKQGPWRAADTLTAIAAYVELERREAEGHPLDSAEVARRLAAGPCSAHTAAAVLRRLEQIAGVAERMGDQAVSGLRPRRALDRRWLGAIRRWLSEADPHRRLLAKRLDVLPTADPEAFAGKVRRLLSPRGQRVLRYVPEGSGPRIGREAGERPARDPVVAAWVLHGAAGNCEGCGRRRPPRWPPSGAPMALSGIMGRDQPENILALCLRCSARLEEAPFSTDLRIEFGCRVPRTGYRRSSYSQPSHSQTCPPAQADF